MTTFRRGDKWAVKVWQGGKWRWVGTFPTRKEARRAEAQAKPARLSASVTVAEFAKRWLSDYARPAPATRNTYRYALQAFVVEFGRRQLSALDRPEVRAWTQRVPMSNARVVRTMYADAMRDGLVAANPFTGLRLHRLPGRKDLTALTEEEIDGLADVALKTLDPEVGPVLRALVLTAGYCGLRPGELFGLEWADIQGDEVTVARTIDSTGQAKLPKNDKPRTLVVPSKARQALSEIPRRVDVPWVFTTARGRRFSKSSLRYWFDPVRSAAGMPGFEFYELRHACATLLLKRGASPMDVAQHLGHSDHGRLVQELYGHPEAADSRDRLRCVFGENVAEIREAKREAS